MSESGQARMLQSSSYMTSNLISEDSSVISQGSFSKVIWEYSSLYGTNSDNFKLLIVNTLMNSILTDFSRLPSIVLSSLLFIFKYLTLKQEACQAPIFHGL